LLIAFLVSMWVATIVQCATCSDVLRWRSLYASYDITWRVHYLEVLEKLPDKKGVLSETT
jgi:hypothetical protein